MEGKRFNDGKPGPGKPKGAKAAPQQLRDMRYVYRTDKPDVEFADDTPSRATCRRALREDSKGFLAMLHKLEAEHRARSDRRERTGQDKPRHELGEDTKELVALIDKLLTECEAGRGR